MVAPTRLHAIKPPTAAEEIRAEVVMLLEEALADAKAGKIAEVLIISRLVEGSEPGTAWRDLASSTLAHSAWIGMLAQTQFDWMMSMHKAKTE